MCTSEENCITFEPMLLWPVWTTLWDFNVWKSDEPVHVLLGVKCCCFVASFPGSSPAFCCVLYIWTSPSEENEQEEGNRLATLWLSAFAVLYCATRHVVGNQKLKDELYVVIRTQVYRFWDFEGIIVYCVSVLSYVYSLLTLWFQKHYVSGIGNVHFCGNNPPSCDQ